MRRAYPGPGALAIGPNAILIPNLQAQTVYLENHFLLLNQAPNVTPLPPGPASIDASAPPHCLTTTAFMTVPL